jgi:hypothetical protein
MGAAAGAENGKTAASSKTGRSGFIGMNLVTGWRFGATANGGTGIAGVIAARRMLYAGLCLAHALPTRLASAWWAGDHGDSFCAWSVDAMRGGMALHALSEAHA